MLESEQLTPETIAAMRKEERQCYDDVQRGLVKAKKALRDIQRINADLGGIEVSNVAMGLKHKLGAFHSECTAELIKHDPVAAGVVVYQVKGGGGDR